jgi:hypothetical protein
MDPFDDLSRNGGSQLSERPAENGAHIELQQFSRESKSRQGGGRGGSPYYLKDKDDQVVTSPETSMHLPAVQGVRNRYGGINMDRLTRLHPGLNKGPNGLDDPSSPPLQNDSITSSLSRFESKSLTKSKELLSMSPTLLRHTHSAQIFEYATFGRCSSARTIAHALIKEYAKKSLSESAPARRRRRKPKGSAGGGGSEGPADADGKALVTEGLGLGNDPLDRGYPAQLPRRAKSRRSKRAKGAKTIAKGMPGDPYRVVFPNDGGAVSPERLLLSRLQTTQMQIRKRSPNKRLKPLLRHEGSTDQGKAVGGPQAAPETNALENDERPRLLGPSKPLAKARPAPTKVEVSIDIPAPVIETEEEDAPVDLAEAPGMGEEGLAAQAVPVNLPPTPTAITLSDMDIKDKMKGEFGSFIPPPPRPPPAADAGGGAPASPVFEDPLPTKQTVQEIFEEQILGKSRPTTPLRGILKPRPITTESPTRPVYPTNNERPVSPPPITGLDLPPRPDSAPSGSLYAGGGSTTSPYTMGKIQYNVSLTRGRALELLSLEAEVANRVTSLHEKEKRLTEQLDVLSSVEANAEVRIFELKQEEEESAERAEVIRQEEEELRGIIVDRVVMDTMCDLIDTVNEGEVARLNYRPPSRSLERLDAEKQRLIQQGAVNAQMHLCRVEMDICRDLMQRLHDVNLLLSDHFVPLAAGGKLAAHFLRDEPDDDISVIVHSTRMRLKHLTYDLREKTEMFDTTPVHHLDRVLKEMGRSMRSTSDSLLSAEENVERLEGLVHHAAVQIQRIGRGVHGRARYRRLNVPRKEAYLAFYGRAAVMMQCFVRKHQAKKRARWKREMLQLREEMAQRKREEKDTVLPRAELEMFSRSVESVDEDLVDEELAMLDDVLSSEKVEDGGAWGMFYLERQ